MTPRHRISPVVGLLILGIVAAARLTYAQHPEEPENWLSKYNPFRPVDPSQPISVPELCKRLDCLAEKLRDDGLVVLKQPDVFSQARMTRFRNDFENQMSNDLGNFHLVLAARINRLDAATTTQTTALSAALAAPGSNPTAINTPPALPGAPTTFGPGVSLGQGVIDPTKGVFGGLGLAPNTLAGPGSNAAMGLGVEPTVYLDEKKRFLEHLNQIRRISLGPDQNDSSGYGLYLIRMPVSITPGEKTYQGFGAELAVHVEHEFAPDFLPTAFQALVVNDVVDQLGPVVYEALRSGYYDKHLKPWHDARVSRPLLIVRMSRLVEEAFQRGGRFVDNLVEAARQAPDGPSSDPIAVPLVSFLFAPAGKTNGNPENDLPLYRTLADRLEALAAATDKVAEIDQTVEGPELREQLARFRGELVNIRQGAASSPHLESTALSFARRVVEAAFGQRMVRDANKQLVPDSILETFRFTVRHFDQLNTPSVKWHLDLLAEFARSLYLTATRDDVNLLNEIFSVRGADTIKLAGAASELAEQSMTLRGARKLNLPSTRTAKQLYPIAPRDILDVFLYDNIYLLATGAKASSRTPEIRSSDVRNYLRHTLSSAYAAMTYPTPRSVQTLPLDDPQFMHQLLETINQREFVGELDPAALGAESASALERTYNALIARVAEGRDNIRNQPIAALCWAIAVDAALLDRGLRADARRVFAAAGKPADDLEGIRFYHTVKFHRDNPGDPALDVFNEYVRTRWPIVTFGLDPVSDQQNIADSFNLKRDLQLALSYAFATGQIGFNQLNTFRRQIEQSSDTIALNRTVTGFVHGNDIFGFRFTPRFQNPPNQRTNIGVITSQLIGGGPGPDYQVKKSKLESGMRELTTVVLIPTFLTSMRMEVTSNWFRLNDPEHLVFHTKRMMEQGRMVQELRQSVLDVCSAQRYRPADLRVLQSKLAMLEAMLPAQSKVMPLPYENSASGFDLFDDGATALVPELTGFSGVDVVQLPTTPPTPPTAGLTTTSPAGLQVTTTTTVPNTTTTLSIVGGTASLADVFVFGKYISLLDTKAIAGGKSAAFEILSREVVHVQIPANATATTDEAGRTYIEVFLATPNGISNSVFIPCKVPTAAAPPQVAFDLDTSSLDVFYQWNDAKTALIASAPPDKKALTIKWDSPTAFAPRRLQVTFQGTINNTPVSFALPADAGVSDNYFVDANVFTATLLDRAQKVLPAASTTASTVSTPVTFTVYVQPLLPRDTEEFRVRTDAKKLATGLTVNFNYQVTGKNALLDVKAVNRVPGQHEGPAQGRGPAALADARGGMRDEAVARTAQVPAATSLPPAAFDLPQLPPPMDARVLQSPNVANEAEQVARMLTGQLSNPNRAPAFGVPQAGGAPAQTSTMVSTTTGGGNGQPIVVMPAPVVVVPSKPDAKQRRHFRPGQSLRKFANRIGQGGSVTPGP